MPRWYQVAPEIIRVTRLDYTERSVSTPYRHGYSIGPASERA